MSYTNEKLDSIYERTDGQCHLCRKQLARKNYGKTKARGAWEVEHSKPQSKGGTNHGNNLYAACVSCNRSKGNGSTKRARAKNDYKAAPYSRKQKIGNSATGAGVLAAISWVLVPPQVRIPYVIASAVIGGVVGYNQEPD